MWGALRISGLCLVSLWLNSYAHASIVQTPKFKVEGIVIVWGDTDSPITSSVPHGRLGPSVRHQAKLKSVKNQDPIITGHLLPIPHEADLTASLSPLYAPLLGTSTFHVASNTAFQIDAELVDRDVYSLKDLAAISFHLSASLQSNRISGHGTKAQHPHSAGPTGGLASNVSTLADLTTRTAVFSGNQRTAAQSGTIAEQSVQFEVGYRQTNTRTKTDMPSVVFTIFAP